jgi:hypothetical protein
VFNAGDNDVIFDRSITARGLFAYTENAAVKDLDITVNLGSPGLPFVITSTAQQLQLFGTVTAAALNTAFTNINISGGGLHVDAAATYGLNLGGIAGMLLKGSSITGCSMTGDVKVSGGNDNTLIGGLVGSADGLIVNSSVNGNIQAVLTASGNFSVRVGGLVGQLSTNNSGSPYAAIRKSYYSTGTVSASAPADHVFAGGITADTDASLGAEITDCYSTGDISAEEGSDHSSAGGIIGNASSNVTITHCYYASGDISGDEHAGGIAGRVSSDSSVTGCAVLSGSVTGSGGRVAGATSGGSSLTNNIAYKDMQVNSGTVLGSATDENGADKTSAELENSATYTGWDFSTVWKMDGSPSRPILKWQ